MKCSEKNDLTLHYEPIFNISVFFCHLTADVLLFWILHQNNQYRPCNHDARPDNFFTDLRFVKKSITEQDGDEA